MADIIYPGESPSGVVGNTRLPNNVNLIWWKGDAQEFIVDLRNEDGSAVNLTGMTAEAVIKQSYAATTQYSFQTTISGSQVTLYLSSAVSKTIPAGDYIWNFQLTNTANGDVRTYLAGDVTVHAEVD